MVKAPHFELLGDYSANLAKLFNYSAQGTERLKANVKVKVKVKVQGAKVQGPRRRGPRLNFQCQGGDASEGGGAGQGEGGVKVGVG